MSFPLQNVDFSTHFFENFESVFLIFQIVIYLFVHVNCFYDKNQIYVRTCINSFIEQSITFSKLGYTCFFTLTENFYINY